MAYADRVKETTTTTGTGAITLSGAATGYRTFAAGFVVGATMTYAISDTLGNWETGTGTLSGSTTLARTTVLASSNGNALVNFPAGSKDVFCTASANALTKLDQATSARVYYLSKMGAIDDADVSMASTTFGTDSTAAIQAVLNLASSTNAIKVIVDGQFSATGLRVKGNTWIDCLPGCGLVLRTNSNKTLLENYNLSFDPAVRTDKNIRITGGIWNGNRNGANVNNNKGTGTTGLTCIMRFYGVDTLDISDGQLINAPSYTLHAMNCAPYTVTNMKGDVGPSEVVNNDGFNTGGFCENVTLRDLVINAGDDPISISPDDVWRNTGSFIYPYYPLASMGAMKNITVENITLKSKVYGVRLMSGVNRLEDVTIRTLRGFTTAWAILLDNRQAENDIPGASGNGNIGTITVDGVNVAVTSGTTVVRLRSSAEKVTFKNHTRNIGTAAIPEFLIDGTGVTIQSLVIENYTSYDPTGNQVIPHILISGCVVKELKINGVTVRRGAAPNASSFVRTSSSAVIETLQANGVLLDGIANFLDNTSGTISRIQATNIVHLNELAGEATFKTASTINRIGLSGWTGTTATSGTFTTKTGDAFATVVDTTPPTFVSAAVNAGTASIVRVLMSEALDPANVPAASAFTVTSHTVSSTAISGSYINLTLSAPFVFGEAARTVAYTAPGSSAMRDVAGNLAANISAQSITNNVAAGSPVISGATYVTLAGDASLVDSGSIKSLTGSASSDSTYHRYGGAVGMQKLAIGTNGWVGFRYQSTAQYDTQVGFNDTATIGGTNKPFIGITFAPSGTIAILNGVGASALANGVAGNLYIVRWVGTSTATVEMTADDGATWTVLYTYSGLTRSADMYVHCALYNTDTAPYMQGVGLT